MNNLFQQSYKDFINQFLKKGYISTNFDDLNVNEKNQLILRHDIDFDVHAAYQIAKIEKELNVTSTFFFLLRGDFYNLINNENYNLITKIKSFGHNITLHYDISIYDNPKKELNNEVKIFEQFFNTKVKIISIHRPSADFLSNPNNYFKIKNTYEDKFFKKTAYFADSGGRFRYGNPLDSKEFNSCRNIQLLTHPIWWVSNFSSVNDALNDLIKKRKLNLTSLLQKNCKTFR